MKKEKPLKKIKGDYVWSSLNGFNTVKFVPNIHGAITVMEKPRLTIYGKLCRIWIIIKS
jgi:hypothetical protein